jgi:hypothetical protein
MVSDLIAALQEMDPATPVVLGKYDPYVGVTRLKAATLGVTSDFGHVGTMVLGVHDGDVENYYPEEAFVLTGYIMD